MSMEKDKTEFIPFDVLLREATQSVEDELKLEDTGWLQLGGVIYTGLTPQERILAIKNSRLYFIKDPLARQAIRLWTDYSFGSGLSYRAKDDKAQEVLEAHWGAHRNKKVLSAQGQRRSSDMLLVDGEVFFALFLGPNGEVTIRRLDPLEITEIVTNPEDIEDVRYYKRQWSTTQAALKLSIYRSFGNVKDEETLDLTGQTAKATEQALVYHITNNTISQRGNPLLLPAIDWIKQYRRFLASRVAIMLALARFAWKQKTRGGAEAIAAVKNVFHDQEVAAGSMLIENMGVDTQPIKQESGARGAYQDGRMLKLQVASATGIPEQYFGDVSVGNHATAKTVELPMLKQFQSYQQVWSDAYTELDNMVLEHNGIAEDKRYVDRDFPPIVPEDAAERALSIAALLPAFPAFADSREVQQVALQAIGIDDVGQVLDAMQQESAPSNAQYALIKSLRTFTEVLSHGTSDRDNGGKLR